MLCIVQEVCLTMFSKSPLSRAPQDLGRGSEGLVLRLREGVFFEQLKGCADACSRQVV